MKDLFDILNEVPPLVGFGMYFGGVAVVAALALIGRRRLAAEAIDETIARYNSAEPEKQTLEYTIPIYQAITNNAWWLHKEDMARFDGFLDTIEARFAGTDLEKVYNFRRRQKEKAKAAKKAMAAEEKAIKRELRQQEAERAYRSSAYSRLER